MKERSIRTLWLSLLMVCFFVAGIFSISMNVKAADTDSSAPEIPGLTFESEMQNDFAECFHIYYYNDDYTLIDVPDTYIVFYERIMNIFDAVGLAAFTVTGIDTAMMAGYGDYRFLSIFLDRKSTRLNSSHT